MLIIGVMGIGGLLGGAVCVIAVFSAAYRLVLYRTTQQGRRVAARAPRKALTGREVQIV